MKNIRFFPFVPVDVPGNFTPSTFSDMAWAFGLHKTVALACKKQGAGKTELPVVVQVATRDCCYMFPVLGAALDSPMISWLRALLQDEGITKIAHSAQWMRKMFSRTLGIEMQGIHDTMLWNEAATHIANESIHETLANRKVQVECMPSDARFLFVLAAAQTADASENTQLRAKELHERAFPHVVIIDLTE